MICIKTGYTTEKRVTNLQSNNIIIYVIKTNLIHYLSSVYFVSQPLNISGIFVVHHQEVHCVYTTLGTFCAF